MKWAILSADDWRLRWTYRKQVRRMPTRGWTRWLPFPTRRHG
jgi:hypothetical protein